MVGKISKAYHTFVFSHPTTVFLYMPKWNSLSDCPEKNCLDSFIWYYCIGWKTGMEDDGKQAGATQVFFSHDNQTSQEQMLQLAEKTRWHFNLYEDWFDLYEWYRACYAFSVIKRKELLFVNGKLIQGYEWTKKFSKGWGAYPLRLMLMRGWRGEVTDVNIYDLAFEKDEMVSWTTSCGIPAEGKILSWMPETYNLTNNNASETVISEVALEDLCPSQDKYILEMFDDGEGKSPAMSEDFCARLNGQLNLIPLDDRSAFAMVKEFEEYALKVNITWRMGIWVAGRAFMNGTEMIEVTGENTQVYPKGGKWVIKNPYTDEIIGVPFVMNPTGHTFAKLTQECLACLAGYNPKDVSNFDGKFCRGPSDCIHGFFCGSQKCDRSDIGWALMCKFQQKLRLRIKGLCKETKFDTDYLLLGYEVLEKGGGHRRKYGGSTGWLLSHNKEEDLWHLKHEDYSHLTLTMEDKDTLPVGVHSWVATNDTCSLGQTVRQVLSTHTQKS